MVENVRIITEVDQYYLQASKKHVNLGFHKGNELLDKDTNKLLQGSGKAMRHIKIKKVDEIQPEAF